MANTNKDQDWKVLLVFVSLICSIALTFWAEGQNRIAFDPKLIRVTLTAAGCEYVQSQTGLSAKFMGKNGSCEMDVDFKQYRQSIGGDIFFGYEDSKTLQISESQVVGIMSLPENSNKSWSHEQRVAVWRFALAILLMLCSVVLVLVQLQKLSKKK